MHFWRSADRQYASFDRLRTLPGLRHAYCTRPLDVSVRVDPRQAERAQNRAQMCTDLGLDATRLTYTWQIHRTAIAAIRAGDAPGPRHEVDALLTNAVGTPLMTFSADCPLILLYDPVARVVGMAHASWRCTVARIVTQLVERMQAEFGTAAANLHAGLGPGAGVCCYEVQDDVHAAAAVLPDHDTLFQRRAGRLYFDLGLANRRQLEAAGVPAAQIESAGICTMCRTDVFYSYRREGAGCGHFGLLAALVEETDPQP